MVLQVATRRAHSAVGIPRAPSRPRPRSAHDPPGSAGRAPLRPVATRHSARRASAGDTRAAVRRRATRGRRDRRRRGRRRRRRARRHDARVKHGPRAALGGTSASPRSKRASRARAAGPRRARAPPPSRSTSAEPWPCSSSDGESSRAVPAVTSEQALARPAAGAATAEPVADARRAKARRRRIRAGAAGAAGADAGGASPTPVVGVWGAFPPETEWCREGAMR